MAAYAALISLSQTLRYFIERNPHNHKQLFQSLQQNIIFLIGVFDEFPRKVCNWEEKIHDSANDAEFIIEDCISHAIWDEDLFHKVGEKIDSVVDEVRREIELISDKEGGLDDSSPAKILFGIHMHQKQRLFGLEHHFSEIKERLLNHTRELLIVPIVGMGGIGKTCLARALFDDTRIASHFDLLRWVRISQSYNARDILLAILGVEVQSDEVNVIELGVEVNRLLFHRRYVIFVDDVWDLSAWDEVQKLLRDDENRSRVVLTTRHQDVARYTKPSGFLYQMQLMNEEASWSLLKYKVFGEEHSPPEELVESGQKIANKCNGLPLAIIVIAGILCNVDLNRNSWENIAKDVIGAIRASDGDFMDILELSYQHLPHYLRPCFLYISAFSEFNKIEVATVVKLWTSEGFLEVKSTYKSPEQTAHEYLDKLLKRNLIVAMEKQYTGRTKVFGMHHLLRDLCLKKAQQEKFLHWNDNVVTCRSSFCGEESGQPYLRSIMCNSYDKDLVYELPSCRHLRILHVPSIATLSFPSQLFRLCHLRYLHLEFSPKDGFELPSEISKLENLQTLTIRLHGLRFFAYKSLSIPVEIWKMSKLRHILFRPALELPNPTGKTSPLVNLLSLMCIRNFRFTAETVKLMPNLKILVVFYDIDFSKEFLSDYYLNNICHLTCLEMLTFYSYNENPNSLLKSMILPSSLKVLKFRGEHGASWEDMTRLTGSLPNLEFLDFSGYVLSGDIWETNEEHFQSLRVLEIRESCLKCWKSESSNPFPNLERLVLVSCHYLTQLPDGIGDIPSLESITVDDQQEAIVNWAKQIKQEQSELGNELLQVSILSISALTDKIAAILQEWGGEKRKILDTPEYDRCHGYDAHDAVIDNLRKRYPELYKLFTQSLY